MEDNWPTWLVGVGAYKKKSLSLREIARTCTNEQLRVLWQAANSSISRVFGRICPRPCPFPPSRSLSLFRTPPLLSSPPFAFLLCSTTNILSHSGPATHRFIGLATPPDTRHVWVRMFGYAKCSRASQVECLMALFCLNTEPDTNGERTGVSLVSAYVRPTFLSPRNNNLT